MRIKDVIALHQVSHDINNGKLFYEKNGTEIGNYFRDSIISDIEALFIYAGIHSKKFGFYRMPAKRFPHAIYYHIQKEVAIVVAILPMRKNPTWLKDNLKKPTQPIPPRERRGHKLKVHPHHTQLYELSQSNETLRPRSPLSAKSSTVFLNQTRMTVVSNNPLPEPPF